MRACVQEVCSSNNEKNTCRCWDNEDTKHNILEGGHFSPKKLLPSRLSPQTCFPPRDQLSLATGGFKSLKEKLIPFWSTCTQGQGVSRGRVSLNQDPEETARKGQLLRVPSSFCTDAAPAALLLLSPCPLRFFHLALLRPCPTSSRALRCMQVFL